MNATKIFVHLSPIMKLIITMIEIIRRILRDLKWAIYTGAIIYFVGFVAYFGSISSPSTVRIRDMFAIWLTVVFLVIFRFTYKSISLSYKAIKMDRHIGDLCLKEINKNESESY